MADLALLEYRKNPPSEDDPTGSVTVLCRGRETARLRPGDTLVFTYRVDDDLTMAQVPNEPPLNIRAAQSVPHRPTPEQIFTMEATFDGPDRTPRCSDDDG